MTCPHCLNYGLEMRYDKKGRPWWYCVSCQVRMFSRGGITVETFRLVSELLDENPDIVVDLQLKAANRYRESVKARMAERSEVKTGVKTGVEALAMQGG